MEEKEETLEEVPILQKEKKPRSPAQVEAFNKARDKRLLLASQKKMEEAKRIEDKIKSPTLKPKVSDAKKEKKALNESDSKELEQEIRIVKKPKKKIIYQVESDSDEEIIVKRREKKDLPPPAPEVLKKELPPSKPKPVYVFL